MSRRSNSYANGLQEELLTDLEADDVSSKGSTCSKGGVTVILC